MTSEAILADITKCNPVLERFIDTLDRLEDEAERREVSQANIFVIGRSDQQKGARDRLPQAKWLLVPGDHPMAADSALEAVKELLPVVAGGGIKRALILTFNRDVLTDSFNSAALIVDTKPFAALPKRDRMTAVEDSKVELETRTSKGRRLSFVIEDALRERNLGPYSKVRQAIWSEVESRFDAESKNKPFRQFIGDCVNSALSGLISASGSKPLVARSVRDSMMRLMVQAGVVSDEEGTPLTWGFSGVQRCACSLDESFRIKADAELVIAALETVNSLGYSQLEDLAGALYHSRGGEAEEMVVKVLQYLIDRGRVEEYEENSEPYFRLVRVSQASSLYVLRK